MMFYIEHIQKLLTCVLVCVAVLFVQEVTTLGLGIESYMHETCPAQPMLSIYMIGNFY